MLYLVVCLLLMSYSLVLSHLFEGDRDACIHRVLDVYEEQGFAVVNFLYFSNMMHYRLLEKPRDNKDLHYKQALLAGDVLLADGIALQVFYWLSRRIRLRNLNGTDLIPWVLDRLSNEYSVSLYVYSVYDPSIGKESTWLERGLDALIRDYPQLRIARSYQSQYRDRGQDFPFDSFAQSAEKDDAEIKLFLNCTGTPFQETWTDTHRDRIAEQGMMVFNAGGFLDFVSGFETRAPRWAVNARVLETFYRVATNPQKNLKKFLRMFGVLRVLKTTFVNSLARLLGKK